MRTQHTLSARSLQYYLIANRWAADLEFFNIEAAFLYRLMDDYFIRLCDKTHFEKLKQAGENLLRLEEYKSKANSLLARQLKQVELMVEDIIPENADDLAVGQVHLEYLMTGLINEYREVKREVFALVESVMKDNKPRSYINAN